MKSFSGGTIPFNKWLRGPLRGPGIGIEPDLHSPGSKSYNSLLPSKKALSCFRVLGKRKTKIGCIILFPKALIPLVKISPK
jgi:hypothetical protein